MRLHDTLPSVQVTREESTTVPNGDFLDEALAYETFDIKDINRSIDVALINLKHATDDDEKKVLQDVVTDYATELAALVLPQKACDELNVHASIKDNESFYHPPHREDVLRLAASAEATGNPTVTSAFQRSIGELPEAAKKLFEQALVLQKSGDYTSFFEALISLELAKSDGDLDSNTFNTAFANTFFDHHDLDDGVDYNKLDQGDPRMERLVSPVATSMEGTYGTKESPRVEFYTPKASPRSIGKPALHDVMRV